MAQKITRSEVDFYLNILNTKLEKVNAPYRYRVLPTQGGYTLYKYKGDEQVDYCVAGQKLREVYEIIRFAANTVADNIQAPKVVRMYWNDPDDGICSQYVDIVAHNAETITVSGAGVEFEVYPHELTAAIEK